MELRIIQDKIYEIRGQRVMLDFDLAALYGVATKVFNQSVKRNIERFPEDFMFRLTEEEWEGMRSQIVTASEEKKPESLQKTDSQPDGKDLNWSHFVTSSENLPENLNSSQIVMSSNKNRGKVYLPYAFTEHGVTMLTSVLKSERAVKISVIEDLLEEKAEKKGWEDRDRIGFRRQAS